MNWPDIFKQRRTKLKLSMSDLSLLLGVSRQAVWNIETGANRPSLEILMGLVRISGPITIAAGAQSENPIESQDQKIEISLRIKK